ncbi:3-hydroxyacyl-CoA dehydrogenase family protein [Cohnella soli]|uniref:L-gulonate 3-dehydrogenase n=1 Tax=Cohnella soli TaxID=425005 RepID=A0ABW0HVZ0_9BACL
MFQSIAVIGAGTMGRGIARLLAGHGSRVTLYDPNPEALHAMKASRVEAEENLGLQLTTNLQEAVRHAELILEAAPENLEIKRAIYEQIATTVGEDTIIASNTSTYPLAVLAEHQPFADRMLIAHFFNPADIIPLVEIVQLETTRPGLAERLADTLRTAGKVPVMLNKDVPGFLANRLQAAVMREACHLLEIGVATAEQVDTAVKEGLGPRWALNGPFEIADFGGLDVWEKVTGHLFPHLGRETEVPEAIAEQVQRGRLGLKSGSGFYEYGDAGNGEQTVRQWRDRLTKLICSRED